MIETYGALIGNYREVAPQYVKVGDVLYCSNSPHAVIQRETRPKKGPKLLLENMYSRHRRTMWCRLGIPVYRLTVPKQKGGPARDWVMAKGDVVVYPATHPSRIVAAIRHGGGWHSTSGARIPQPDVQLMIDVIEGRAVIVRSRDRQPDIRMKVPYRCGSVIAVADPEVADPSVWVRVRPDLWRSSTGVGASDAMIRFEMDRHQTYQLLWMPDD